MQWVLLTYRLPREPSTPRIALWRRLRKLGALQVGDGLAALPLDDRTREKFDWLAGDVDQSGGEAIVWVAEPSSKAEARLLEAKLAEAIAADYRRLVEAADAAEERGGAARRRALTRLRRQLDEVRARDHLRSPERRNAEAAVSRLAKLQETVA